MPGMFVREQLREGIRQDGILAPQQGVTHNVRGEATALVVGADGKVQSRILTTDRAIGNDWLVTKGLNAGDRVIVRGVQMVQPGIEVTANEVKLDGEPASPRRRRAIPIPAPRMGIAVASPAPPRRPRSRTPGPCHVFSSTARSLPGFWPSS